ncbi:MAG: hypothetical protein ACC663_04440 [Gammaproteobacteria bacterium]
MAHKYLRQLITLVDRATRKRYDNIELECKHFFSGAALYANNRICITFTPVGLALKLPQHTREELLTNKNAIALQYFPKAPIKKNYVLFPEGVKKASGELEEYLRESIDYVLGLTDAKRIN